MKLDKYNNKRNFNNTKEPIGKEIKITRKTGEINKKMLFPLSFFGYIY